MKLTFFNKDNFKFIFFLIFWISIISSIGAPFISFENDTPKYNQVRSLAPFFFLLITLFFFYKQIYLNLYKNITLNLFFLLNIFYLLGQFLYFKQLIKPETSFIFYSFCTIVLFLITKDFEKNLKYYLGILLIMMTIIYLFYAYLIIKDFFKNDFYWLYSYKLNDIFLDVSTPRVTGTSRSLSIIFLALSIYFIKFNLKNIYSFFILISLFVIFILIWGMQSRGTFLCLSITMILLFFIYYKNKIKKYLLIVLTIAMAMYVFDQFSKNKLFIAKILNINTTQLNTDIKVIYDTDIKVIYDQNPNFFKKSRILTNENISSGRLLVWNSLYENYNFTNFFGYGGQADRYLLKSFDPTYTNASNGFIYAFICGGYFSFFILIIIFFINLKFIFNYHSKIANKQSHDYISLLSFCIIIFFSIRIFFENSFSLFSLDFILYILSSLILRKKLQN
jgi:hypothetical protein